MPIKTSSAKAKGRRLQQWVRDCILAAFPKLHSDDVRSTSLGVSGEDILLSKAARNVFPYSVECKSLAKVSFYRLNYQAVEKCPEGAEPLVVIKADRCSPIVIIDAEYFFSIIRRLKK